MNFRESNEYLYGLGNEVSAMKLGLENIKTLLEALGNPEKKYVKVQIAGTNGKGSTCVFLEAICVRAGIKVGLTTSPHLISITERVKIGGAEISEKDFARHASLIREASEKLVAEKKLETVPTFFEQVTAIALNAFAQAEIELAILETGLGGRFDATTAARAEIVAVTPIDYDHEQILGDTLTKIAAEKAAIIRADTRAIIAPQQKEAEGVLAEKCREVGVVPIRATENIKIKKQRAENGFPFLTTDFTTEKGSYKNVVFGLKGRHQLTNAATAIALAETLSGEFGYKISNEDVRAGLENAEHKGRLEFYGNILFDGAHNVAGAKALRNYLDEFIDAPVTLIFAAMNDKNLSEIAAVLFPKATRLIFTKAENSRSVEPQDFLNISSKYEIEKVFTTGNVAEAVALARKISGEDDLILITGSLYLIGEAQKILQTENYV